MAKIEIPNLVNLKVNCIDKERTFDHDTIDERIEEVYVKAGYHTKPKTPEEAKERNETGFNGLMSSFSDIEQEIVKGMTWVTAEIMPTRYLIGQAMRDYVRAHPGLEKETIDTISPCMANVSLLVPVKYEGKYYLVGQLKGKALGAGQVHAAAVAGNIKGKYVMAGAEDGTNPLIRTLEDEAKEEINMKDIDSTSFIFLVDERETGQVNFACVARNSQFEPVRDNYLKLTKGMRPEELEVSGLPLIPIGLSLIPVEKPEDILQEVLIFKSDGKAYKEKRDPRPYTQAVLDYLLERENQKFLLEKAGF